MRFLLHVSHDRAGLGAAGAVGNNKPLISISVCTEKIRGCHPRTVRARVCVRYDQLW